MHWNNPPENIDDYFGFCYEIKNKLNGMSYIGKKQFFSITKKKIKGRKNKVTVKKESDWKTYTSSSIALNQDIITYGIHNFEFNILSCHKTRALLNFHETKEQWTRNVLYSLQPDGSKSYYNGRLECLRYSKEIAHLIQFL